jgi:hypothetical protein
MSETHRTPRDCGPANEEWVRAFERPADGRGHDETDISLRAYLTRIPERQLLAYVPHMLDDEVIAWDGNFRDDGTLMLVCCERDVGIAEYRLALNEYLEYRQASGMRNPDRWTPLVSRPGEKRPSVTQHSSQCLPATPPGA